MGPAGRNKNSREYWLKRAQQSRALAEDMHDPMARETMFNVARSCEELARFADYEAEWRGEPLDEAKNKIRG